jgi:hypothetical protein
MSVESKAHGTLTFADDDEVEDLLAQLGDDDSLADHADELREQLTHVGARLELRIHVHLSNDANLVFQEWLTDLVDAATSGHLDTWQEDFGDSMYVRLTAGSDDEAEIEGPYPH